MLTTEEITEMLMHHDELLEMYRMQINELTKEYDWTYVNTLDTKS